MIKKLKRIISIALLASLMLSTNAFAAYTDVSEESDIYSAVRTLSTLGILNGYEDNAFRPNANITRAEMCAILCRALGAKPTEYHDLFTDVTEDHWASKYITFCGGQKIVSGMGDGTFEPDGNVTYEQAVKMIISAIGYNLMAEANGGWPDGYLKIAHKYGVSTDVKVEKTDSAATRGTVAQLMYNALTIPLMVQVVFGTPATFAIMDGTGDYPYNSLITTDLGIAKISGSIVGTSQKAYNKLKCADDEVIYRFDNANDDEFWKEYLGKNADKDNYATYTFKFEKDVPVNQYLDTPSDIYVKKISDTNYTIIDIRPAK